MLGDCIHLVGSTQFAHLGHLQAGITTGIDARKGFQVHGNIESQAMIAAATAYTQAQGSKLAAILRVYTRRLALRDRGDIELQIGRASCRERV